MASKAKTTAKKSKKSAGKAATSASKANEPVYRTSKVHKSERTITVDQLPTEFSRADLEFIGVDHSGASYEARVFVNNPQANENTPTTEDSGYAGSFNIFGHGECFGDVGHCDINKARDQFDPRPSHPLQPIRKVVIATGAIKKAVGQGTDVSITVVPVIKSWTERTELGDVLKFDHINLVTYD